MNARLETITPGSQLKERRLCTTISNAISAEIVSRKWQYQRRVTKVLVSVSTSVSFLYAAILWLVYKSPLGGFYDLAFGLIHLCAFYFIFQSRLLMAAGWAYFWSGLQICGGIVFLVGPDPGFQYYFFLAPVLIYIVFTDAPLYLRATMLSFGICLFLVSEFFTWEPYQINMSAETARLVHAINILIIFTTVYISIKYFSDETKQAYAEQSKLVLKDNVTGLPNRLFVQEFAGKLFATCGRYGRPFSLVFIQIDRYEEHCRNLGFHAMEAAIQRIADKLDHSLREADIPSRYDDGEFLILAPEATAESAYTIADRFKFNISNMLFGSDGHHFNLNVNVGITSSENNEFSSIDEMLASVFDAALEAKTNGAQHIGVSFVSQSFGRLS